VNHLANFVRQTLSFVNLQRVPHLKFTRKLELRLQFAIRGASHAQKLPKLTGIQSAMPFSNVARLRNRCTPNLIGEPIELFFREVFRQPVHRDCQLHSPLPNDQISK